MELIGLAELQWCCCGEFVLNPFWGLFSRSTVTTYIKQKVGAQKKYFLYLECSSLSKTSVTFAENLLKFYTGVLQHGIAFEPFLYTVMNIRCLFCTESTAQLSWPFWDSIESCKHAFCGVLASKVAYLHQLTTSRLRKRQL